MDPVAIKFALVTLVIVIVLSLVLILARRAFQGYRGKDNGRSLPRGEAIGLLIFGVVFIACLAFLPWAAFLLAAVAFGGSIICFVRLPRDVKVLMKDAIFGSQVSTPRKIVNFALLAGGLAIIAVTLLDRLH